MKKRLSIFLLILICLILSNSTAIVCLAKNKIPTPTVEEDVYIYDEDSIIDDDVETKLNKMLIQLEKQTEIEFAVVSIESLNDYEIEEYSNELFNDLGLGKEDKDNGILLLISRSDTRVRLEIGRGLEGCLNDAKCGRILDDYFVPYREDDKYTEAADLTVQAVINALSSEYEFEIDSLDKEVAVSEEEIPQIVWIIIIIILYIIISLYSSGGSGRGYSGSSFGGGYSSSSSGSSFGGFGGGSSGGGGASR